MPRARAVLPSYMETSAGNSGTPLIPIGSLLGRVSQSPCSWLSRAVKYAGRNFGGPCTTRRPFGCYFYFLLEQSGLSGLENEHNRARLASTNPSCNSSRHLGWANGSMPNWMLCVSPLSIITTHLHEPSHFLRGRFGRLTQIMSAVSGHPVYFRHWDFEYHR